MLRRTLPLALALLAFAAPRPAHAAVSLEAFYGFTRPGNADFSQAVSGAANDPHLLKDSLNIAGGDLILHLGTLELGVIADTSFKSGSASQTAIGGLIGIGGDVGSVFRLEALGEVGAQRYGDFLNNKSVVTASSKSEWFMYVGLRPGIAVRLPTGGPGVLIGVWGFARWDLTTSNVPVTVASASGASPGSLKLGGTTVGAELRLGLDF